MSTNCCTRRRWKRRSKSARTDPLRADPGLTYRLPPAAPARADFFVLTGIRHVLLVPASSRGAWFLRASPLSQPDQLIPRIGSARLLRPEFADALLPQLAQHFRLRTCTYPITKSTPATP